MTPYRVLFAAPDAIDFASAPDIAVEVVGDAIACRTRVAEQTYDAIVLDHALSDDLMLVAQVRAATAETPILVVTAAGDDAMAVRAIGHGATDFLPRDHAAALPLRLRVALARRTTIAAGRLAEERFRSVFEHSPIGLWEEDATALKTHLDQLRADGVTDMRAYFRDRPDRIGHCMSLIAVLDVNQASLRQYEAPDKASLIAGLGRTLTAESGALLGDQLVALAEGCTLFEAETTARTFSGRTIDILLSTLVAPGSEDTFSRLYVTTADITARKQAEAQVHALALFPQLNPHAVLQLSADGAIGYANPASAALARSLGAELDDFLPPDTPAIVAEVLATNRTRSEIETRHGARTLAWSFHPVVALQIVHCYAVDITERLHLEEQLRQSQKMEAIGQLAGGIAHDFNNLLTVIYGNTVLLRRAQPSDRLDNIATATDRAAALVRQLLAFGRRQLLQPAELDLNATVVDLVQMLARVVREDIEVRVELADHPVWTLADASMLDQVLMNLVVNARDAMADGGTLVLTTSIVQLAGLPDLAPGTYARLSVRDTGTGIAPENLPRIFEPFFTTKELGKGTGLGLSTVFGIVRQHGGTLEVSSELGRGTTVTVYLPAANSTDAPVAPVVEPTSRGGTESILLVEDEEAVRRLVHEVLEMHGYRVHAVGTGAEALAEVAKGTFDLVLTDVIMPGGISGRDLADRLRAERSQLKVIYMSGYTGELAGRGLDLREGQNFLQKPFGPGPLLACVRACLDAG